MGLHKDGTPLTQVPAEQKAQDVGFVNNVV